MANNPIMVPMTVASDSAAIEMSVGVSIGGGSAILGTKEITNNGVYNAAADGYDGYSSVDVQVSGGSATLGEKTVTANGVYNASSDSLDGYSKVTVSVPASAVDSGTKNINTNGTHDVIGYASANVAVPASAVDSGTKNITANGNGQDVVGYAAVNVAVPNSYSASDEGKVVSNGALVAQTSDTVTANDTYDTTLINSLTVNVSGGGDVANGDQFVKRYTSADRFDAYDTFSVDTIKPTAEKNALSTNAETVCFWNMTGASGQYTAQFALRGIKAKILVIPKVTRICVGMIQIATLEKIDAAKPRIDMDSINSSTALNTLILRGDSVPTLSNISAFNNTCFASGKTGGTLYVPQSLISSYQAASNWSTILGYATNSIKSIESTHTDPTAPIDLTLYYADGTPISS